jgi:hypothetical protein
MLVWALAINTVLVCSVTSLAQCAERGDVPYISEVMLLCKREGRAFVPWVCFFAFAAMVMVQLTWMEQAATVWFRTQVVCGRLAGLETSAPVAGGSRSFFGMLAVAAVVGFGLVVRFDWRDAGEASTALHRVGVVLLAFGGFGSLQVVWMTLRGGDCVARLRGEAGVAGDGTRAQDVPWLSWVEVDVAFVVVLCVFMVTTVAGGHATVSAVFEYIAFALLLGQTTWLFVLCWERDRWTRRLGADVEVEVRGEIGRNDRDGELAARLLWALLATYGAEAVVVLVVVL